MMAGITRKTDDPEDSRRIDEMDRAYAPRSKKRYTSKPSIKQLQNVEVFVADDGSTRRLAVRLDGDLYWVELSKWE